MLPVWNRTRKKKKPRHEVNRNRITCYIANRGTSTRVIGTNENLNLKTEKSLRNIRFHDKVDDSGSESNSDSAITESYVCSCLNTSSCDLSSSDDEKRVYTITQPGSAGSLTTSSEDSKQLPPSSAPPFPSIGETSINWKD